MDFHFWLSLSYPSVKMQSFHIQMSILSVFLHFQIRISCNEGLYVFSILVKVKGLRRQKGIPYFFVDTTKRKKMTFSHKILAQMSLH